jgi:hypothetical protein
VGAYRHQAFWRQTVFNEGYADSGVAPDDPAVIVESKLNDQITIDELNLQRVSAQDYRELRQYLEGAEPNEAYEGVRAITGQGVIAASNLASLEDKAWALNEQFSAAACRQAFASLDPKGVGPFSFKRDTLTPGQTKALRFFARPGPARPVWIGRRGEGYTRPWSFQLVAFDPFAYDETETQTTVSLAGSSYVVNPGNVYTKPRIRVTLSGSGPADFQVQNNTTVTVIQMNLIGSPWNLLIDTARSTIVDPYAASGPTNQYALRTYGFVSNMWLAPGPNLITIPSTANVLSVRFDFRGAYA